MDPSDHDGQRARRTGIPAPRKHSSPTAIARPAIRRRRALDADHEPLVDSIRRRLLTPIEAARRTNY
jgi:hypothetical protein